MDKYDEQIAELTANLERIEADWSHSKGLFDMCYRGIRPHHNVGCLTMVRGGNNWDAQTPELTEAIRADERIPKSWQEITIEHLPVFAEWQRRLDAEL